MVNSIDLTPFIGSGFDLQRPSMAAQRGEGSVWLVVPNEWLDNPDSPMNISDMRPRLNHRFVLDDYYKLRRVFVEGLVFNVFVFHRRYSASHHSVGVSRVSASGINNFLENDDLIVNWIECIGVEKRYEEQAELWGCEVVEC